MELYFNSDSFFTRWVVENRLLRERFVVVDIGCLGMGHPMWELLGDFVDFYGFDPIDEVIEKLKAENRDRHFYFNFAIGNKDENRTFFVKENVFASSFIETDARARFCDVPPGTGAVDGVEAGARRVEVRKLDTMFAEGLLPRADFIKIDCEGFEPEILSGAVRYMSASGVLGVVSETTMIPSKEHRHSHFHAIMPFLSAQRLLPFDFGLGRVPRPVFAARYDAGERCPLSAIPSLDIGQPIQFDFLFARDFVTEDRHPDRFFDLPGGGPELSADRIIKTMMIFELHGLSDCAFELAVSFRPLLEPRFDVGKALDLLLRPPPHARNTPDIVACLAMIAKLRTMAVSPGAQPENGRRLADAGSRELVSELMARVALRLGFNKRPD